MRKRTGDCIFDIQVNHAHHIHIWFSVGGKNKFVHLALQHTLNLVAEIHSVAQVQERLLHGLDIAAVGDNDFYSQRAQVSTPDVSVVMNQLCNQITRTAGVIRATSNDQVSLADQAFLSQQRETDKCAQNWHGLLRSTYHIAGLRAFDPFRCRN